MQSTLPGLASRVWCSQSVFKPLDCQSRVHQWSSQLSTEGLLSHTSSCPKATGVLPYQAVRVRTSGCIRPLSLPIPGLPDVNSKAWRMVVGQRRYAPLPREGPVMELYCQGLAVTQGWQALRVLPVRIVPLVVKARVGQLYAQHIGHAR